MVIKCTGFRQEDVFLGHGGGGRVLAEKPPREPLRVLQADTAMAELALVLSEQLLLGRIVEVDSIAVWKVELEMAE